MAEVYDDDVPADGSDVSAPEIRANFRGARALLGSRNWCANDDFPIWSAGDAAAPDYWQLTGAGAAIARSGTGIAGPNNKRKYGDFCAHVTAGGGAAATLQQRLLQAAAYARADFLQDMEFSAGIALWSASAGAVRVGLYDGVDTKWSNEAGHGNGYHSGGSAWEWINTVRRIGSGGVATELALRIEAAAGTQFYASGALAGLGPVMPLHWQPCVTVIGSLYFLQPGDLAVLNPLMNARPKPQRPFIALDVDLELSVAPTGQKVICDAMKNGSSMFATKPEVAIGATQGNAATDGTYANRCFARNDKLTVETEQVGSGTKGSDLTARVTVRQYVRAQEGLVNLADVA